MVGWRFLNTAMESTKTDARYTIGDGEGLKVRAFRESIIPDTRHAVGDGDRGKARAAIESLITNACHAICFTIVSDR